MPQYPSRTQQPPKGATRKHATLCNPHPNLLPLSQVVDDYRDGDGEQENEALDRSNRRRKRSQRYTQDFVEAVSDVDSNFDSDDDIMGEAVYDDEYMRSRKQNKPSSASEEDEEFQLEEDAEDDDEERNIH
uniref:Uncharacterized protein n=1 Tax=Zea mays TaxID=4577 RepID=A0A804LI15_MAIZE